MKVIIAGSRTWADTAAIERTMAKFPHPINEVVSGGAPGVDIMGEAWAKENLIPIKRFPAAWRVLGRKAGVLRNEAMAVYAGRNGALVAFWDGQSKDTADMCKRARLHGMLVWVVQPNWLAVYTPQMEFNL